jgi:colanic acid biosynthesis glycosyl transferase WcaI
MNSVKILFLSPFFYPEAISTGKYNTALVRAMIERGAVVDVVAFHPFYPAWKPVRSNREFEGANIYRGGAWVRYPRNMVLRRSIFELSFTWHAACQCLALRKDTAIAVAIFPPSLFFVLVSYLLPPSIKKIGIVHDLQSILGLNGQGLLKRLLRRGIRRIESGALRSCDRLIVLSEAMARTAIAEFGLDPSRVVVHYPFVTVRANAGNDARLVQLLPQQVEHVVYSGALGKKQNPFGLLEFYRAAAAQLPDVHFHFFSEGPAYDELRKFHGVSPEDRIHFHALVNEADLEELYARSTVQLIPQLEGSTDACFPSKLPNILATGCMVLAICKSDSELGRLLQQTRTGLAADSWEISVLVETLKQALKQARSQSRQQRQAFADGLLSSRFSLELLVDTVFGHADGKRTNPNAFTAARELGLELNAVIPKRGGPE